MRDASLSESPYFSADELRAFGFASVGDDCRISRKCSFYAISGSIGSQVRIDDFCILKGHVEIGSYVHVAAFCSVSGAFAKVELKDFCTLSNRVSIFSGSDDYAADTLNNSQVPEEYTTVRKGPVTIGQAVLVGAHSVILPGVTIGDGGSVGAMAVVVDSVPPGGMARAPGAVATLGSRRRDVGKIMDMARRFLASVRRI
ncbi:MAG: acyltransferase [Alphaproteobacteria bacterium]|nr:acyltransferase [Alphaproteobacteria bacterium]